MRTPLNYTGNKSRLVSAFKDNFPKKIKKFVDLFCGGGTVGLSVDAEQVFFVDSNKNVIELLKHLSKFDYGVLLERLERLIHRHQLSYSAKCGYQGYRKGIDKQDNNGLKEYNSRGFYKLRQSYNAQKDKFSAESLDMLYLLMVYGFNNDIRFNSKNEYNLPAGKTDLNKSNLRKLEEYIKRVGEISCKFICEDFRSEKVKDILLAAEFVYADPPYLLGKAVYNENGSWTQDNERDLITLLKMLDESKVSFALSNVIEKAIPKIENKLLKEWVSNNEHLRILNMNTHYRSSSYNKKNRNAGEQEVLIVNSLPC